MMKVLGVTAGVTLLATASSVADYPTSVLGDNPAGYWRFNDGAVATPTLPATAVAPNLGTAGSVCDGSYVGRFAGVPGALAGNGAVNFYNGNLDTSHNGSVDVPNHTALNPGGAFTVEFWAKPSNDAASLLSPVNSMSFSPGRAGYLFYQNGNTWQFRIGNHGSTTASLINGGTIVAHQWQHVVGTYSGGASGTMTMFVNGVQVATGPVSLFEPNNNAAFRIGRTSGPNREFDGAVDEVVVYTNVLSAGTIAAHYSARTTNAANYAAQILLDAPTGYWRLGDLSQNPVAANSSAAGSQLDGLYNYWSGTAPDLQGPTYPGFETGNTALQTGSGTNGFASFPGLNLNANTVTMECWIKRNGAQASFNGVLFHRGGGGTATGIMFRDTSNELGYHWNDAQYGWVSGLTPPDGVWTYVALAVSPDMAVLSMYDGTTWSSATNVAAHGVQAFGRLTRAGSDQDAARFFNGLIDEAAIYGRTLTEGQLRTHALAGFGDSAHNPPIFVSDPPTVSPSGTIYSTTPFSLTTDVYGEPPLTFQWRHAGTNLPGATGATFTRASSASSDAGAYVVVVGNTYGSVTSSVVNVAINPAVPPSITSQPANRFVYPGGAAAFTVAADGTTPFTYQWKHAGTNLPGATTSRLVITNCGASEAGAYTVGVTNVAGGVLSGTATLTLSTPVAGSFAELVITNGPLAYWRLSETSGTTAFDYAGGNDGAIAGGVLQGMTGLSAPTFPGLEAGNTAYMFDGSSANVQIGNPTALNFTGRITMMAWVKPTATDGLRNIVCHGYQTSPNNAEVGLRINAGSYQAWTWGGGDFTASAPIPAEDIGNWVFLVGTYDGTSWHLYRNGVELSSTTGTTGAIVVSDVGWAIGARGNGTERYFSGELDEVAIFNQALSSGTIAGMYAAAKFGTTTPPIIVQEPVSHAFYAGVNLNLQVVASGSLPLSYQWKHAGTNLPGATTASLALPNFSASLGGSYQVQVANTAGNTNTTLATLTVITPTPGTFEEAVVSNRPIAYWRLGETSGTTAYDYAGGYDGTYYNVMQGQAGAVLGDANSAAGFDGSSSYVGTGRPMLNNRPQFTVMGWLKRGAIHSTRGGYFGQNDLLEFGDAGSGASVEAWINATGGNIITPWPWPDDQWGFIVLTGDGITNALYIDGQVVGTRNATVPNYGSSGYSFNIGGGGIFNNTGDYFNGTIDDVAVFDRPLSAATVAAIYSAGLFGNNTPPSVTRDLPPAATVPAGTTLQLSADFKGSLPLNYQWKKGGVSIPGATTTTLTLANIYFTDAGSYTLWATNGAGHTNTTTTVVTVMPPPSYALATNDLVLHLRFDGTYEDSSGRGNLAYAPTVTQPGFVAGKIGQGVHIATTAGDNYLQVVDTADLEFFETNSFSVGFWVKYTGGFSDVPIIGNSVGSTYQLGWVFTDSSSPGRLEWSLVSTANSGTYLRDPVSSAAIGDGTWHQVLGVVDREQQVAFAYIDGVLVNSWSLTGLGTLYYGNAITIGQDPTGNYGAATFDLDDVGIWRRAVSRYEAAGIYAAAQSGASFDVTTPVRVYVNHVDGNVDISWQAGTLLQSTNVNGTYLPVPGAVAPFHRTTPTGTAKFYRVAN
jgi:hypothetical protein